MVQYLSTLEHAAANDLPEFDNEIDQLSKALEGARSVAEADAAINKNTASAAAAIAKILLRAALDHWRQHEIRQVVRETDNSIQVVVAGLKEVIEQDFMQSLDSEAKQIEDPFNSWIAASQAMGDPDGAPAVAVILRDERLVDLRKRKIAAAEYVKVLETIGQGHHALATTNLRLDDDELSTRIKAYSKDLQTLFKSIKTLSQ